jgi:hypothetical protein
MIRKVIKEENELDISSLPDVDISADRQILKIIMDAERQAVKSGKEQSSMIAIESLQKKTMRFLLEQEESDSPPIDVGTFGIEIMRIVKNFDTMLDIPSIIIKRAQKYLLDKYGKEMSEAFIEYLKNQFDFSPTKQDEQDTEESSHLAVGAMGGSTGGGI